tara:strand:+ start:388 stop:1440 length:1053 start_codon:yes stop_codon:yes gene_type:complete
MKTFISLFIISIITGFFIFFQDDKSNEEIKEEVVKKIVEVEIIKNKKFSKKLKLRGFTQASRVVTLKSQVEGKISSKSFTKGMFYKAGTQLILIDPEDKVAKLKEMEALLNQRKKEYQVAENLFEKGFRSEVKLTESRTNFENALALFEKSQVELNNTKIIMPFDSSIEESYVELGDYVKKGDSIAKIVDLDPIYINLSASEKEINELKLNQKGKVFIGKKIFEGRINYISKTSDPETRNFTIQVEVRNKNSIILSGLSTEIEIILDAENAFFVPSSLITLNDIGELGLKIILDEIVKFVPVSIISDTGRGYWIKINNENLKNEIIVITQGHEYTVEGEIVDFSFKNNDK